MPNREMENRAAIEQNLNEHGAEETEVQHKTTSKYIYEQEGVPNDQKVVEAIDAWANIWGERINAKVGDAGLLDPHNDPEDAETNELWADAAENIIAVLPSARFSNETLTFDGGFVQLHY